MIKSIYKKKIIEKKCGGSMEIKSIDVKGYRDVGVLLIHDFVGTPLSLKPQIDALKEKGYYIKAPLLPGHGTDWKKLKEVNYWDWIGKVETSLYEMMHEVKNVFVGGLSMGGTLSIHMAENHPDKIKGIFPINPAIKLDNPLVKFIWFLKYFIPSIKAPPTDTKDKGVKGFNYKRIPTQTIYELYKLLRLTEKHLKKVICPVLLIASYEDHIVPIEQKRYIFDNIPSKDKEIVFLKDSYHTSTLVFDKDKINKLIINFIESHL